MARVVLALWLLEGTASELAIRFPPELPRIEPFTFSVPNETVSIGPWRGTLARGSLEWPGLVSGTTAPAAFYVLSPLLSRDEVASMLDVVRDGGLDFDSAFALSLLLYKCFHASACFPQAQLIRTQSMAGPRTSSISKQAAEQRPSCPSAESLIAAGAYLPLALVHVQRSRPSLVQSSRSACFRS